MCALFEYYYKILLSGLLASGTEWKCHLEDTTYQFKSVRPVLDPIGGYSVYSVFQMS